MQALSPSPRRLSRCLGGSWPLQSTPETDGKWSPMSLSAGASAHLHGPPQRGEALEPWAPRALRPSSVPRRRRLALRSVGASGRPGGFGAVAPDAALGCWTHGLPGQGLAAGLGG